MSPKLNVIAQLEFELVYFEDAGQHFIQYATRTPSSVDSSDREGLILKTGAA